MASGCSTGAFMSLSASSVTGLPACSASGLMCIRCTAGEHVCKVHEVHQSHVCSRLICGLHCECEIVLEAMSVQLPGA